MRGSGRDTHAFERVLCLFRNASLLLLIDQPFGWLIDNRLDAVLNTSSQFVIGIKNLLAGLFVLSDDKAKLVLEIVRPTLILGGLRSCGRCRFCRHGMQVIQCDRSGRCSGRLCLRSCRIACNRVQIIKRDVIGLRHAGENLSGVGGSFRTPLIGVWSAVIHLECFDNIAPAGLQILGKELGASIDILRRVIGILDAESRIIRRHDLSESLSPLVGGGLGIVAAFRLNQSGQNSRWQPVFLLSCLDQIGVISRHSSWPGSFPAPREGS